jgi:hypothetical protein
MSPAPFFRKQFLLALETPLMSITLGDARLLCSDVSSHEPKTGLVELSGISLSLATATTFY